MSRFFLSPKSRLRTSPLLAHTLNTLNMLAPLLLLAAVTAILFSGCPSTPPELRAVSTHISLCAFALALATRIAWGITIHLIRNRTKKPDQTP